VHREAAGARHVLEARKILAAHLHQAAMVAALETDLLPAQT
jgi:hypothetical protein